MLSPRAVALILASFFVLPALMALVPTAAAAPGGTELATDPQGDAPTGAPETDILRLGVSADGDNAGSSGFVHFFITVVDIDAMTGEAGYQVQFKGAETQPTTYNVIVQYSGATNQFTSAQMTKDTDPLGAAKPVTASWTRNDGLGDTIKINIARSDLGNSRQVGKAWSAIIAETFPIDDSPTSGTNVDQTNTPASWTVATSTSVPDAVADIVAQAHASHIQLSWSAPFNGGAAITTYHVYEGATEVGTSATTSFDHTGLSGGSHTYQVSAENSNGQGPKSDPLTVLAQDPTVASAARNLVAQAGDAAVTLTWQAPLSDGGAAITGYRILMGAVSGGEAPLAGTAVGLTKTVTGLQNNQIYYFRVAAVNSAGDGAESNEVSARPNNANVPVAFSEYERATGGCMGEPSGGVDPVTGDIMIEGTGCYITYKVSNMQPSTNPAVRGTAQWDDVSFGFIPTGLTDGIGFLDQQTGRYIAAEITTPPDCSQIAVTDDLGAHWTTSTGACASGNGVDHETVGGGPWTPSHVPGPTADASYPNSVYYCEQADVGATCAVSEDGGITFGPSNQMYTLAGGSGTGVDSAAPEGSCIGIHGHVKVALDGVVAVPNQDCFLASGDTASHRGVVYSLDDGAHWHLAIVPGTSVDGNRDFDPSLTWSTVKAPGAAHYRLWYAYSGRSGDHKMWAQYTDDLGATWSTPVDVGAGLSLVNTQFAETVSGDPGRAAVQFLGATQSGNDQDDAWAATWNSYVATTFDAGASWQLAKTSVDPVQKGCISAGGTTSATATCTARNLLDFNDLQMDAKGNVVAIYADGCTGGCAANGNPATNSASGSTASDIAVAVQRAGRTMLSAFDATLSPPEAPTVTAAAADGRATISWIAPHDGGSPITSYQIQRNGAALATTGATNTSFVDLTVTNGVSYVYAVAAVNAFGTGAYGAAPSVTPQLDVTPPSQVTGLEATATEGQVALLWDTATDDLGVDHYVVMRDGAALATVAGSTTGYTDAPLQNGRPYSYTVEAVDGSGLHGAPSDAIVAKPVRVPTTKFIAADPVGDSSGAIPTDLTAFGFLTTADSVRIEWTARDLNAGGVGTNHIYYVASFKASAIQYDAEYDHPGTRCAAYHNAGITGVVAINGVCGTTGNVAWMTIPRASLEEPFADGDDLTLSDVATGTIPVNPTTGTEGTSTQNDALTGTFTYVAGSPATAQPLAFDAIADQAGSEGSLLAFTAHATSPEGDYVTYSATGLPTGATLDADTGDVAWTPTFTQAGTYPVTIKADTGAASATRAFNVTIANTDRAPVLDAIAPQNGAEGALLTFQAHASDPDGTTPTLSATNLPTGATFNPSTGTFSWTPSFQQAGAYTITVRASDGQLDATQPVDITIVDVDPSAPTMSPIANATVTELAHANVTLAATSPSGEAIVFSSTDLPAWAHIVPTTAGHARIQLDPGLGTAGTLTAHVVATSAGKTSLARTLNITIVQAAGVSLTPIGSTSVKGVPTKTIQLSATIKNTGPEDDSFTVVATSSARWATSPIANVTLAAGASDTVTFTVTVPANGASSTVSLKATSRANSAATKTATWSVSVPLVITLALDQDSYAPGENVRGNVTITYWDGTLVPNANVKITQAPETLGSAASSSVTVRTGTDGTAAFDFGTDVLSWLPDTHDLTVAAATAFVSGTTTGSYEAGP